MGAGLNQAKVVTPNPARLSRGWVPWHGRAGVGATKANTGWICLSLRQRCSRQGEQERSLCRTRRGQTVRALPCSAPKPLAPVPRGS